MISSILSRFARSTPQDDRLPSPDLSRIFPHMVAAQAPEPATGDPQTDATPATTPPEGHTAQGLPADDIRAWLQSDLDALSVGLADLAAMPTSPKRIRALFLVTHNLLGTAEPYGYPVIERLCASLCRLLERCEDAGPDLALINLHISAIRAAAASGPGAACDQLGQSVCTALEQRVNARREA